MAIANDFPLATVGSPTSEWTSDEAPRVKSAKFGDGYEQTVVDGLNALERQWNVTWEPLTLANKNTFVSYLRGKMGSTPFLWTPPGEASPVKVKAVTWNIAPMSGPNWSVKVLMKEVFDVG